MKSIVRIFGCALLSLASVALVQAQTSPAAAATEKSAVAGASSGARTEMYHVHFAHAAPGKAYDLGESYKTPGPNAPAPGHEIVLRHRDGDSWDYVVIGHYGTKFTVEAARQQVPNAQRDLSDWHNDTLCNGPSWTEFSRALGIGDDASKTSGSVYVVSTNRASPGHREQLEKLLGQSSNPATDKWAGTVLLQHLEGSPWQYLAIVRYNSWQEYATEQVNNTPKPGTKDSGWFQFREHVALHADTLCTRIQP